MIVGNNNQVTFDRLHSVFRYVEKPAYAFTDFIGEFGLAQQTTTDMETGDVQVNSKDIVFDPIVGAAYARPLKIPHINTIWHGNDGWFYYGADASPYFDYFVHQGGGSYYYNNVSDCYRANGLYKFGSNTDGGQIPIVVWQIDYQYMCKDTQFFTPNSNKQNPAALYLNNWPPDSPYFWSGPNSSEGRVTSLELRIDPAPVTSSDPSVPSADPLNTSFQASARVCCQGFLGSFTPNLTASNSVPAYGAYRWRVSAGSAYKWYSLSITPTRQWTLAYSNDGDNYVVIKTFDIQGNSQQLRTDWYDINPVPNPESFGTRPINFQGVVFSVLLIAGKMKLNFGFGVNTPGDQSNIPFVWSDPRFDPDTGTPVWTIDTVQVAADEFTNVTWNVNPIKFATVGQMVSNDQNIGFVPDSEPDWRVHYAPSVKGADEPSSTEIGFAPEGCSATAETYDVNGTTVRYLLTIDNDSHHPSGTFYGTPYADYTAAVRAVSGFYRPHTIQVTSRPQIVEPIRIAVHYDFDFSSLRITSRAELTFENYSGEWSNAIDGGWVEQNGHVAVAIDMGIEGYSRYRRLTGIANTAFQERMGQGGASEVTIHCQDTWLPLDTPVWNLPWMDGWNIYYMIYYLANLRGVSADRMQFYNDGYVPSTPYGVCPNGAPSYFMPVGPAGTPLTRFGGGQLVSEIMRKVSFALGYILFFDVNGILQFYKFQPTNPGPYKQTFTYVPEPEGFGKLTEIWGGAYDGNLRDVRNQVTVVGVNAFGPIWNPLVFHASDDSSILDDDAFNFLGYPNPLVWMDNIFVDPVFGQSACNNLLQFLRIPPRNVNLTTWMQPDTPIFPLDIIQVSNPKSAASFGAKDFLVVSVSDIQEYGEAPTTQLSGRWLPPQWLQTAQQGVGPSANRAISSQLVNSPVPALQGSVQRGPGVFVPTPAF